TGIASSCNNLGIYHNALINNDTQISGDCWPDTWSAPLDTTGTGELRTAGNFWSTYWGEDNGKGGGVAGDWIGDTLLPAENGDNYPLMDSSIPAGLRSLWCNANFEYSPAKSAPMGMKWGGWNCDPRRFWYTCTWSPIDAHVTNELSQELSKVINEIGLGAHYMEDSSVVPGHTLARFTIPSYSGQSPSGETTLFITGLADETYEVEHWVRAYGEVIHHLLIPDGFVREGETQTVVTSFDLYVDPDTGEVTPEARLKVGIDVMPGS
ncbi:unnamed protein product, partial [marine sediment metagenome]